MSSVLLWMLLGAIFVAAVYGADRFNKRRQRKQEVEYVAGMTVAQRHPAAALAIAVLLPIIAGIVLVNTAFGGKARVVRKTHYAPTSERVHSARPIVKEPKEPKPVLKMVVSDDSIETDISVLNACGNAEVTVVRNGQITCQEAKSPEVQAWFLDAQRQENAKIKEYVKHVARVEDTSRIIETLVVPKPRLDTMGPPQPDRPPVMRQGVLLWLWQAATPAPKPVVTEEKKEPQFKDKYAELFFFLALVLGVLSKYFWDFYEAKKVGNPTEFEAHVVIMSFIVAALVYYSIQQGLEKEAGKLTVRGAVFAFNNGFMWQTILKSMRPAAATAKTADAPPTSTATPS